MSLTGFTLRTAAARDAEALARFAERTFRDTFGPHNRAEDMDGNLRAIAFYARRGFRDVGGRLFQLGADVQTDRIMVAPAATL